MIDLEGLPVADRVVRGLRDLEAGRRTVPALWLLAASQRLQELGLPVPQREWREEPERALYEALEASGVDDPYYRYNAMRAELDSFLSAGEARRQRDRRRRVGVS